MKAILEMMANVERRYCTTIGINMTSEYLERKLFEEVGELSQALLTIDGLCRPGKKVTHEQIEDEIADVIGILASIAFIRELDIHSGIERKWLSRLEN